MAWAVNGAELTEAVTQGVLIGHPNALHVAEELDAVEAARLALFGHGHVRHAVVVCRSGSLWVTRPSSSMCLLVA